MGGSTEFIRARLVAFATLVVSMSLLPSVPSAAKGAPGGACAVIGAAKVGTAFAGDATVVKPGEEDRATFLPGGIETACQWRLGGGSVFLALLGAGKGGAKAWNAEAMYEAIRPRQNGAAPESTSIPGADAAVFLAASGGDRLVVRAGDVVLDAESTVSSTPGGNEKGLVALARSVLPAVTAGLFTSSKARPELVGPASAKLGTSNHDVTYCSVGATALKLDLYYPARSTATRLPVIVFIHGGQLIEGDKQPFPSSQIAGFLQPALDRGYAFVSINYRLAPAAKFPAMVEDSKCAIRYLRANAAALAIDPDRIGVIGSSSGGYLATFVALTDPTSGFEGSGGYAGVSSRVAAAVDEFGANMNLAVPAYGPAEQQSRLLAYVQPPTQELIRTGTPWNFTTPDDPPFLVVHGDKDPHVNPQESKDLHSKLVASGVRSTLLIVQNGSHGWSPQASTFGPITPTWEQIVQIELDFFDTHLKH
jgi:acetyl esterase/lipase